MRYILALFYLLWFLCVLAFYGFVACAIVYAIGKFLFGWWG